MVDPPRRHGRTALDRPADRALAEAAGFRPPRRELMLRAGPALPR